MNRLFKVVKEIIPKISDTELIALRSGTTSIDRQIFKGSVPIAKARNSFSADEDKLYNKLDDFLEKYGHTTQRKKDSWVYHLQVSWIMF